MHSKIHEGRNVKRIREILGIKQEALAVELGEDWNQKKVSLLEQKEEIDQPLLEQVAKALKVENPVNVTTSIRSKLTTPIRSKLTRQIRCKLTTP